MMRFWPALLVLLAIFLTQPAFPTGDFKRWHAGSYSYSDEMGGFSIVSISGTGTIDDPVILTQEFYSASPVTLVIHAERPIRPLHFGVGFATGIIHMRVVTINNSGLPWLQFRFELQEVPGTPSMFGDGLSFDQRRSDSTTVSSDRYEEFSQDFEPYDQLLFRNGISNPLETATFNFLITDFTPRWRFYLVQDPSVPIS